MKFRPMIGFLRKGFRSLTYLITTGGNSSGILDPNDSKAYIWGANDQGLGGNNRLSERATAEIPAPYSGSLMVTDFDLGSNHALAIEGSTGYAYAWGLNSAGQLGDNSGSSRSSPVSVVGGRSYIQVAGGNSHSLAIEGSTGRAYAWGLNTAGQIGDNSNSVRVIPTSVAGGRSFIKISGGNNYSLAIEGSTGNVYAWGTNISGQLGDNTIVSGSSPVSVAGGRSFSAITAGSSHAVGIEGSTGYAYAWGTGSGGLLGDNTATSKSSPTSVAGGRSFSAIAAGISHTVGIEGSTGNAYAWGSGSVGRLGNNNVTSTSSPTSVVGGRSYNAIAVGNSSEHTLALEKSTGNIWAWGNNIHGQLGVEYLSIPRSNTTIVISRMVVASGVARVIEASTGRVYAWGSGSLGILGDNTTSSKSYPVSVVGGRSFSRIASALQSTAAIEASTGRVYAWGYNATGSLGDNTAINRSSPTSVAGGRSFSQIAGGTLNDHFLAIEGSTGRAYAWGSGQSGKLGDNTTTARSSPISVAGGRSYSRISVNSNNSLAIEGSTGRAYAWGSGSGGFLGDNTTTSKSSPNSVAGGRSFSAITAGSSHAVGIEGSTGNAYAWGTGSSGQLGDNTQASKSSPVSVAGGRSFSAIAAGSSHTVGIEGSTGNAYAWGSNNAGQLGVGDNTNYSSPRSVVGGRSFNMISTSAAYEESTGIIYIWGSESELFNYTISNSYSSPVSVGRLFL